MKKMACMVIAIVLIALATVTLTGCTPRDEVLKIYNWGEYMDTDDARVLKQFEAFYKSETGKKIKVEYKEFSTNEDMYTEIKEKKADYDLVCPSDYMVEKMLAERLLQPFDADVVDLSAIDPAILAVSRTFDPENKYAVPYMWGTFGIMYNVNEVDEADMSSWDALFSSKYSGKIYMKDSVRDAYATGSLYANKETILLPAKAQHEAGTISDAEYNEIISGVINDKSSENIARVMSALSAQKPLLKKYEVDDGKEAMIAGSNAGSLGLFWSCDAGYAMSMNSNLRYAIPDEGSNVYVDAFVIPKYAGNKKAANMFLQFLNDPEIALANMEYVGAPSPVIDAAEEFKNIISDDDYEYEGIKIFRDSNGNVDQAFKQNFYDMMFPSEQTLVRCAALKDFGSASHEINMKFIELKGGDLNSDCFGGSSSTILLIASAFVIWLSIKRFKI